MSNEPRADMPFISSVAPETDIAVIKKEIEHIKEGIQDIKDSIKCFQNTRKEVDTLIVAGKQLKEMNIPERVRALESDKKYFVGAIAAISTIIAWLGIR